MAQPKEEKINKTSPIGDFDSIQSFTKNGMIEIVEATKAVNAFPQGAARDLYCAHPTFGKMIENESSRIMGIVSKVLKWQNIKGNIQRRQQDDQFEILLDCNDAILERLNSNLDEMAGIKKHPQPIVVESRINSDSSRGTVGRGVGSWNLKPTGGNASQVPVRLITAKNIPRPQLKFKVPVNNSSTEPFIPRLKEKPNSLAPLAILPEYDEFGNVISYPHPYEFELEKFEVAKEQMQRKSPQTPHSMEETELVYVDNVEKLNAALKDLCKCKEIAIDVEHHSYRTFLGFTCLVQISTRERDYLFDALELRDEMHVLNVVFTNPKVIKIFHGSDSDVEWLQRDLSLYIVNMFDSHQAAKALNLARLSLFYLLKHYCNIEVDKTLQLADWRIRPLPPKLIDYARQDTHYLIYIFERMTNDLLDAANQKTNLLQSVYQRSKELCKKRYVKPVILPESHMDLFRKSKRNFNNRQLCALRDIFHWRDTIAREEDESLGYVLPNHMMLQIAESLPREMQGILACCNPMPPLVRQHLHTLHQIVLRAREQPLEQPILETEVTHRVANLKVNDYNNKLYCPHDLSHAEEFRDDLPTTLNLKNSDFVKVPENEIRPSNLKEPSLDVFDKVEESEEDENAQRQNVILPMIKFVSPFQRYMAVLPLVEKEKLENAERLEKESKKKRLCPESHVKEEPNECTDQMNSDNPLNLPIQEFLKRKYEEVVANKAGNANGAPPAKRLKTEESDDKLKFVNIPNQSAKAKAKVSGKQSKNTQNSTAVPPPKAQVHGKMSGNAHNSNTTMYEISSEESDEAPEEMPSSSQAGSQKILDPKQRQSSGQRKKKKRKANKSFQSSNKPIDSNFNYKEVDFKKFKGGAQRTKGAELQPRFVGKGKSNKATNKQFNKLFTFSNVKSNKK